MTPSRQVACPHDYVFGTGEDIKIMYNELNIFQWVQGFAALIDNEQNLAIKGTMLNHLELLMQDAQLLGWEATRYTHGVVLSKIEKGKLSWLDTFGISEARRSAVNAKSGSIRAKQSNLNYQNFSKNGGFQNQASSNSFSKSKAKSPGEGLPGSFNAKACKHFNNKICSHKKDHRHGNVLWKHVCSSCWSADHLAADCPFLMNNM
jgi:hypothetical protein